MLGVEGHEVRKSNFGWSPVYASENLAVMSVAFMLQGRNDAVIWRGPRKNGLIKQFLTDVEWGPLDFLVVDAPPGTSDEHISICQVGEDSCGGRWCVGCAPLRPEPLSVCSSLLTGLLLVPPFVCVACAPFQYLTACGVDGAVIVTTPQEMSLLDVRKEISFTAKVGVRVLGVVENMAGFACPSCKSTSDIFPAVTGGARAMSAEMKVPFLGSLPIDPLLLQSCEEGKCYVETHPSAPAVQPLLKLVDTLLDASPQLKQTKQERLAEANANMADSAAPVASAAAAAAPASSASATVLVSSWLSVWNAKDAAGISGLFAPSGTFLSPMGQTSVGRAAIAAGFVKMFAGPLLHDGLHPASEVEEQSLEANTAIVRVTLQRKRKAEAPALSEAEQAAGPTPPTVMTLVAQRDAQSSIGWSIVAAIGVSKVAPPPQK
jgi:uncharacterized protein (TIGR02246 family)